MAEKKTVEIVCDACGKRGNVEMHHRLAEAVHSHSVQDKITEVLCNECSAKKGRDSWSLHLGHGK